MARFSPYRTPENLMLFRSRQAFSVCYLLILDKSVVLIHSSIVNGDELHVNAFQLIFQQHFWLSNVLPKGEE